VTMQHLFYLIIAASILLSTYIDNIGSIFRYSLMLHYRTGFNQPQVIRQKRGAKGVTEQRFRRK